MRKLLLISCNFIAPCIPLINFTGNLREFAIVCLPNMHTELSEKQDDNVLSLADMQCVLLQVMMMKGHYLCLKRAWRSVLVSLQFLLLPLSWSRVAFHLQQTLQLFLRKRSMSSAVATKTRQSGEKR